MPLSLHVYPQKDAFAPYDDHLPPNGSNRSLPLINTFPARSTYTLILIVLVALAPTIPGLRDLLGEAIMPDCQEHVRDGLDRLMAALDQILFVVGPA